MEFEKQFKKDKSTGVYEPEDITKDAKKSITKADPEDAEEMIKRNTLQKLKNLFTLKQ